jgi:hypothetical protein
MHHRQDSMKKTRKPRRVLCVACGDELDQFAFSPDATNVKAVVKRYAACREKGKFKGQFCARLFIAGDGSVPVSRTTKAVSAQRIDRMKRAVVARIAKEELSPTAVPMARPTPRKKKASPR